MLRTLTIRVFLIALCCTFLAGCGDSNSPTGPAPPVPESRVISEGSFHLGTVATSATSGNPCDFIHFITFSTTATATIDVTVDWTFASDNIDVAILRGGCSCGQVLTQSCQEVAESVSTTAKPEHVVALNQPAGTYTLGVDNFGAQPESCSYQIIQTTAR